MTRTRRDGPGGDHAKKSLGQNFLVDGRIAERIVRAISVGAGETIVEIGPGRGALTTRLVESGARVIGIELDRELVPFLEDRFATSSNFKVVEGDVLEADICSLIAPAHKARIAGSLPYYISTAVIQHFIGQRECIEDLTLMLQREVVDRIQAEPGNSERGYLSVLVQYYFDVEKLFDVSPAAFSPQPKIWSSAVQLRLRTDDTNRARDESTLWKVVSAGFAQKRKTIFNNLRTCTDGSLDAAISIAGGAERLLEQARIEPRRRAETLTIEEWISLADKLASGDT